MLIYLKYSAIGTTVYKVYNEQISQLVLPNLEGFFFFPSSRCQLKLTRGDSLFLSGVMLITKRLILEQLAYSCFEMPRFVGFVGFVFFLDFQTSVVFQLVHWVISAKPSLIHVCKGLSAVFCILWKT